MSAGHSAVTESMGTQEEYFADTTLTIDPSKCESVHLVKSHVFYANGVATLAGSTTMDGNTNSDKTFPDYIDAVASATKNDTKTYYNTTLGLHTDKIATVNQEDETERTFDLDLRAWYNGAAINVGMVLDASGSMGFTSDTPEVINVFEKLGIEEDGNGGYQYIGGGKIQVGSDLESLTRKISGVSSQIRTAYPKRGDMIGYYSFTNGNANHPDDNNDRDWFLNSVSRPGERLPAMTTNTPQNLKGR